MRMLCLTLALLGLLPATAHARSLDIERFHAEIEVGEDGVVRVEEHILVRFEGGPTCSVLCTLQGRAFVTEVGCTMDSIEAGPTPPLRPVVEALVAHECQGMCSAAVVTENSTVGVMKLTSATSEDPPVAAVGWSANAWMVSFSPVTSSRTSP